MNCLFSCIFRLLYLSPDIEREKTESLMEYISSYLSENWYTYQRSNSKNFLFRGFFFLSCSWQQYDGKKIPKTHLNVFEKLLTHSRGHFVCLFITNTFWKFQWIFFIHRISLELQLYKVRKGQEIDKIHFFR